MRLVRKGLGADTRRLGGSHLMELPAIIFGWTIIVVGVVGLVASSIRYWRDRRK
jgi:hypothetical protein